MAEDKPVHIRREAYPEIIGAEVNPVAWEDLEGQPTVHLLDYWKIVVARRWTVIAVLLTIVSVTMISTFKSPPIYRAETTIQIDRENPNILNFKDVYQVETVTDDALQTQYKILSARSLARRTIQELKLEQTKELAKPEVGIVGSVVQSFAKILPKTASEMKAKDDTDDMNDYIDRYSERLFVTPVQRSRLVKVAFEATDPELAAKVINKHADEFIQQNLEFKVDATQLASTFLGKETQGLKAALEKSEDKLQEYSRAHEILFTEEGRNTTAEEKLRQLEEEFTKAQADRIQKEAFSDQIVSGNMDALPHLLSNSLISQLTAQAADLRRQEANLAVTFDREYPSRQRIRSQIEGLEREVQNEKSRVLKTVQADYEAAVSRERKLARELTDQRQNVTKINQEIIQYDILKREVESNKQIYQGLLTRLKEAGVSAGLNASNIRVVDRAEIPEKSVRPRKAVNFFFSIGLGLVLGLGIAFFQEYLDNTFKSPDDVTKTLRIPTLAVIPKLSSIQGGKGYKYGMKYGYSQPKPKAIEAAAADVEPQNVPVELIIHTSPGSLMAEAYRSLRTSVLLSSADRPPRSILVTSSVPSEGKTATAVNLAVSLTQSGSRTLIIDADMRKPRVHTVFGLENVTGLSSFLTGSASLQQVIHQTSVPNLFVVPCGMIPPNPGELILSNRFNRMMEVVREYFEYVIIDSPPLSNVSDGRVLANSCEGVLLVIKASATSRHAARKALDNLSESRAHTVGAILNDVDVRSRSGDYSYYYAGSGGYKYGS
jgi:polysaccharide biosynthesis transport protein